jgi:hypothetical protein
MKRLILLVAVLLLAGCGSKDKLPYLGRWHGDFVVDKILQGGTDKDRQREGLRGSLQVYATDDRLILHLEGEQEVIDVNGTWEHTGTAMTLRFTRIKIDDMGGANLRDPNLKFIPSVDVRTAFQRNMVLHLSRDKQKLNGLEVSIGPLTGHFLFTRSTD